MCLGDRGMDSPRIKASSQQILLDDGTLRAGSAELCPKGAKPGPAHKKLQIRCWFGVAAD